MLSNWLDSMHFNVNNRWICTRVRSWLTIMSCHSSYSFPFFFTIFFFFFFFFFFIFFSFFFFQMRWTASGWYNNRKSPTRGIARIVVCLSALWITPRNIWANYISTFWKYQVFFPCCSEENRCKLEFADLKSGLAISHSEIHFRMENKTLFKSYISAMF